MQPEDASTPLETVVRDGALRQFAEQIILGMGARREVAAEVARHLVGANLTGHDSHGVLRLTQYVALLDAGQLQPDAEPELLKESASLALFDARRGFGQWSTRCALDWCLERAREHGIAAAALRHSMHAGRLGDYAEEACRQGLVAVLCLGVAGTGVGIVAPFGGSSRYLGTNPWAIGVPARGRPPLIVDFATSAMAEGKVRLRRAKGERLPEGVVVSSTGAPTTSPEDLYAGGALTGFGGALAGHKGYGLGLAAALLGGLSMIDDPAPTPAGAMSGSLPTSPWLAGVFLAAIDPEWFGGAGSYAETVSAVLRAAGQTPPSEGVDEVLVPGEPEARARDRRQREGIAIPHAIWEQMSVISKRFGVELPR